MDGLSSVASAFAIVSLAGELVTGVQNLYRVWISFQNAPERVRAISEDLKLLITVLRSIEDNEQRYGPDKIMTEILQKCRTQVDTVNFITDELSSQLSTGKSSRRGWAALKTTFQQDKLTKIQDILRDLKVTLSLAQQNAHFSCLSNQLSILTAHAAQQQQPTILIQEKKGTQRDPALQPGLISTQPSEDVLKEHNLNQRTGVKCRMESILGEQSRSYGWDGRTKPNPGSTVYRYGSSSKVHNIFGTFSISSEARQTVESLRKDLDSIEDKDMLRSTTIRMRPAWWLVRLGICYGLNLDFEHGAQPWKHTLSTFRSVPNDALIFSACKEGDIFLVRRLLESGDASTWDCNESGWTPLHFAAQGCHANLCCFLTDRGADRTALDEEQNSPLFAALMVDDYEEVSSIKAHVDTLRIFLDDMDFSPDASPDNDGWLALSYCTIYNSINYKVFDWLICISIPAMAANFEVSGFVDLVNRLFDCDLSSRWPQIPVTADRMIRALDRVPTLTGWLAIHQSIAAFRSTWDYNAAGLLTKGVSPHSVCRLPLIEKRFTPTALAILSSMMFCRWRANLLMAGIQIQDFIEREVTAGSIQDHGWGRMSLAYLFKQSFAPCGGILNDRCARCKVMVDERSPIGDTPELAVQVEVAWCLELEDMKRSEGGAIDDAESSVAFDKQSHETRGIHCPCVRTYDFVCLLCWEALRYLDHKHGAIQRSETTPAAEILLNEDQPFEWEDSMFLLSI